LFFSRLSYESVHKIRGQKNVQTARRGMEVQLTLRQPPHPRDLLLASTSDHLLSSKLPKAFLSSLPL